MSSRRAAHSHRVRRSRLAYTDCNHRRAAVSANGTARHSSDRLTKMVHHTGSTMPATQPTADPTDPALYRDDLQRKIQCLGKLLSQMALQSHFNRSQDWMEIHTACRCPGACSCCLVTWLVRIWRHFERQAHQALRCCCRTLWDTVWRCWWVCDE